MTGSGVASGELRPLMFSIGYRMLGSVTEAEDVVQEAFLRLHASAPDGMRSPEAYAVTVTTRLAIDALRSARHRREQYVGAWLPEPLVASEEANPARQIEMDETVSVAFLVLLERLSPVERAVFLLREVFGYQYSEVAAVTGRGEATCRQVVRRARQHIQHGRIRFQVSAADRDRLAGRFSPPPATATWLVLKPCSPRMSSSTATGAAGRPRCGNRCAGQGKSPGSSWDWPGKPAAWDSAWIQWPSTASPAPWSPHLTAASWPCSR
jgi:RNA polymerase sigma factor (sigma-70 family)